MSWGRVERNTLLGFWRVGYVVSACDINERQISTPVVDGLMGLLLAGMRLRRLCIGVSRWSGVTEESELLCICDLYMWPSCV